MKGLQRKFGMNWIIISNFASCLLFLYHVTLVSVESKQTFPKGEVGLGFCPIFIDSCRNFIGNVSKSNSEYNNLRFLDSESAVESAAKSLLSSRKSQFSTSGDDDLDFQVAKGFVMVERGFYDEAESFFTHLINENPRQASPCFGRAMTHAYKSVQDSSLLNKALEDLTTAFNLGQTVALVSERKAEVLAGLGRFEEAYKDIANFIDIQSSSYGLLLKGLIEYNLKLFDKAEESLRSSLKIDDSRKNIICRIYLAMSLFEQYKYPESIEVNRATLKMSGVRSDVCLAMALAKRNLGDYDKAQSEINQCLSSLSATSVLSKEQMKRERCLLLHNAAMIHYTAGNMTRARENLEMCRDEDPSHLSCLYASGLVHLSTGDYQQAVREFTQVIIYNDETRYAADHRKARYLREYSRYIHWYLDQSVTSLNAEQYFGVEFMLRLSVSSSKPAIQEPSKEANHIIPTLFPSNSQSWQSLKRAWQELLCISLKLGEAQTSHPDGLILNKRIQLASGIATLHIAQLLHNHWSQGQLNRIEWRELYNIAARYRSLAAPDSPIFWVDQGKNKSFVHHVNCLHENKKNLQFNAYIPRIIELSKMFTSVWNVESDGSDPQTLQELVKYVLSPKADKDKVISHITNVKSIEHREKGKMIKGLAWTFGIDRKQRASLNIQISNVGERPAFFEVEMEALFSRLQNRIIGKQGVNKFTNYEEAFNTILSMSYMFALYMPVNAGVGEIAHTVLSGMALSLGKSLHSTWQRGKLLFMEAILAEGVDTFLHNMKSAFSLRTSRVSLNSVPNVTDVLPYVSHVVSALNVIDHGIPSSCMKDKL